MDKALQTMISNMPDKTGKSLQEWHSILKTKGFTKHSEAVNFLKKEYKVTHGFANTIVSLSKDEAQDDEELVRIQYQGKEALIPMYESLLKTIKGFGNDITITPKKTSVSIIRKRQFALIKPGTKSRIDLGLKLKNEPVQGRLESSGPFGAMCTHRIQLTHLDQVDEEVRAWLQEAYNRSV